MHNILRGAFVVWLALPSRCCPMKSLEIWTLECAIVHFSFIISHFFQKLCILYVSVYGPQPRDLRAVITVKKMFCNFRCLTSISHLPRELQRGAHLKMDETKTLKMTALVINQWIIPWHLLKSHIPETILICAVEIASIAYNWLKFWCCTTCKTPISSISLISSHPLFSSFCVLPSGWLTLSISTISISIDLYISATTVYICIAWLCCIFCDAAE